MSKYYNINIIISYKFRRNYNRSSQSDVYYHLRQ